jgi:hypothetical protein
MSKVWERSILVLVFVIESGYGVVVEWWVVGLEMVFERSLVVLMVLMALGLCECILAAMPRAVIVALCVFAFTASSLLVVRSEVFNGYRVDMTSPLR